MTPAPTGQRATGMSFVEDQANQVIASFEKKLENVSDEQLRTWVSIMGSDLFDYLETRMDDMLTVMSIRTINPGKSSNGSIPSLEERGIRQVNMEGVIEGANLWRSVVGTIKRAYKRRNAAANFEPSGQTRRSGVRTATESSADLRRIFSEPQGFQQD